MGMRKVSSAERESSQLPEYIGRYRAEKLLGQGRSGSVYLAYDEQIGQPVAVKLPMTALVSQSENADAYLAEARMVASLAHPHIVPVLEVGSDNKFPCFVVSMYVEGVDLRCYAATQHHNPHETAEIIVTLAGALEHAHRRNLCHLNLRPGTILVDSQRNPWLLGDDFIRAERLAADWWIPGNPCYFSPEQVVGEQALIGPLSDIYSLGVVFYQLLTGRAPYRSEGGVRLCEETLNPSIIPPSKVDDRVPRRFDHICVRAMARSARERYQTMSELADDLTCSVASRRSQ